MTTCIRHITSPQNGTGVDQINIIYGSCWVKTKSIKFCDTRNWIATDAHGNVIGTVLLRQEETSLIHVRTGCEWLQDAHAREPIVATSPTDAQEEGGQPHD